MVSSPETSSCHLMVSNIPNLMVVSFWWGVGVKSHSADEIDHKLSTLASAM